MSPRARRAAELGTLGLLLIFPFVGNDFWVVQVAGRTFGFGTVVLSLVFLAAYAGMLSLAQMTVAGVAGYAFAACAAPLSAGAALAWPLAIPVALGCAILASLAIGLVAVRTEGIYTLMITFAAAMGFYYLALQNYAVFNGFTGFTHVPVPAALGVSFERPHAFYYLCLAVAAACFALVRYLVGTPFGLALQTVRDNPRRLRALGYPIQTLRMLAFGVAGLIAGLGGLLNLWLNGSISPRSVGLTSATDVLIAAVLGGLRHPAGAHVGAFVVTICRASPSSSWPRNGSTSSSASCSSPWSCSRPTGSPAYGPWPPSVPRAGSSPSSPAPPKRPRRRWASTPSRTQQEETPMLSRRQFGLLASAAAFGACAAAALGQPRRTVRLGALATLDGPLAELVKDGFRGLELAFAEFKGRIEGLGIELFRASSDSKPDVALASARRLVEQDKVDILIGPLSGSEGIRIKDYAKAVPGVTFVNGSSAAVETTLVDPAPNFYRFNPDGAQLTAGLGRYIKETKGWNRIVLVANDYSFAYAQILGLMDTYCTRGGTVVCKFFAPLGTKNCSAIIAQLPEKGEADAVFVVLGGADAVNFLTQYAQAGGDLPIIAGSLTVDQTVLNAKGPVRAHLPGVLSSGPVSANDDSPAWRRFADAYRRNSRMGWPPPPTPASNTTSAPRRPCSG